MCGILAGFTTKGRAAQRFSPLIKKLEHRGPDAKDGFSGFNDNLFLAHTRLKILDLSDHANQPLKSPCGRYTLIYNGEIYNYIELRNKLSKYWEWKTNSDTEVILAAWTIWGANSLHQLNGMFAFAIFDSRLKKITLVRDRFGIKPLYYSKNADGWIIASEIQPILSFYNQRNEANKSAIRTYLEKGLYDHSKNTFFSNVYSLEPGSLINIDLVKSTWEFGKWYNLVSNITDLSSVDIEDIEYEAENLINNAIKSHLIADVDVGLNVSGGVDSSMLVEVAKSEINVLHLFNQDYENYSELNWVNKIAAAGKLHVISLDHQKIKEWIDSTVQVQAEPFGGVTVCGYNELYRRAEENNITVLLDGNGVDEIFLGYKKYHDLYVQSANNKMESVSRAVDFQTFWGTKPAPTKKESSIDGTWGLRENVISKKILDSELIINKISDFDDPVRNVAAEDLLYNKIPRGLRFNDRVSMAHSRELRVPFLDHNLVEFAFGIPINKLINHQGTKSIFRKILSKKAPKSIAYATKRSVQSPQREWFSSHWKKMLESIVFSESFIDRNWVDTDKARIAYQDYLSGNNSNSFFLWQWFNLELWAREYLD
ncbi:MAG: asparagine synthase (glutamine-hydrolyzing) [Rhodopirellula sp.]|nr:asparagine synthase (glutamine-hydrolyzing) [Rhodopirellula sp.]|tara:strand:+ start:11429 stop:13219 length:1791 start_codon:yes stop_codon:yes gene_type:complete